MTRKDGRELDEIRRVEMLTGFTRFAEGSCYLARMAQCICREVASLYTESWTTL